MSELLLHSRTPQSPEGGLSLEVTPQSAGWDLIHFSTRTLSAGAAWNDVTRDMETCLVLLEGTCVVRWGDEAHRLGPRRSVFESYPHAVYLPPDTPFSLEAEEDSEIADARVPARQHFPARVILPHQCGLEIRGGGNATRQIVDVMPPEFPADRLLCCEVFTPSGNWSSYPPHKHDVDNPPSEVKLEEVYYYRFREPEAYGFQRLYSGDRSKDVTLRVEHGDVALVHDGYHPFVTAYGYDAYYLNFLAGQRRSMAASDDPTYARFRENWPAPDPRLPLLTRPQADSSGEGPGR